MTSLKRSTWSVGAVFFVNGFVFNFESPATIVARKIGLRAERLPDDWLESYLAGVQGVTPCRRTRIMCSIVSPSVIAGSSITCAE